MATIISLYYSANGRVKLNTMQYHEQDAESRESTFGHLSTRSVYLFVNMLKASIEIFQLNRSQGSGLLAISHNTRH